MMNPDLLPSIPQSPLPLVVIPSLFHLLLFLHLLNPTLERRLIHPHPFQGNHISRGLSTLGVVKISCLVYVNMPIFSVLPSNLPCSL